MTDRPHDAPAETAMQRALRLKKASLDARPKPPRPDHKREQTAGMAAGASKPWMKR